MRETDEELRARVRYVAADGQRLTYLVDTLTGAELDAFAADYGLRRLDSGDGQR